ncbi:hypothetical protein BLA29_000847 [Euroglyphus maynei]|uniref:Cytochrome c oxidase copper chaperone-like protein n=1 Tax=Euroglyphus maynei TaxID=6958 RepID=A0A1Y3AYU4_EURMA|nr:hypothetical protein BLA29_000847 [Euroglyphus maynei]
MPCDGESGKNSSAGETTGGDEQKKPLKPCCACPETRKKRDECIIENGEANCTEYIEAHKECLRKLGFNI